MADAFTPDEVGELLGRFAERVTAEGAGLHRKPGPAEHGMPLPLGSLERAAAQETLDEAVSGLARLRLDLDEAMTDAAFAAAVARVVVPLERAVKELCR